MVMVYTHVPYVMNKVYISIPIIDHVISAHKGEIGLNIDLVDRLLLLLVDGDIQFVYKFWKLY